MRQYSSGLTHYPRASSKVFITLRRGSELLNETTSSENKGTDTQHGTPPSSTTCNGKTGDKLYTAQSPPSVRDMPAFSYYEAVPVHPVRFTTTAEVIVRRSGVGERSVPIHITTENRRKSQSPVPGSPDWEASHLTEPDTNRMLSSLFEHLSNGTELFPSESDGPSGLGNGLFSSSDGTNGIDTGRGREERDRETARNPNESRIIVPPLDVGPITGDCLVISSTTPEENGEEPILLRESSRDSADRGIQSPVHEAPLPLGLRDQVSRYLAEVEEQNAYLRERNKFRFQVIPDGNCLYRAVCRATSGDQSGHLELRERTIHHIADHLEQFSHVIEGDVGEFLISASQDGAWAGYPELLAMSQMLQVHVHLTTGGGARSPTVSTMVHYLGGDEHESECTPPRPDDIWLSWLSNGHYDVILDQSDVPNPEYEDWCMQAQAQRRRDEELARAMAASLSRMYLEQNGK
ncbi:OTU domain-containing protein 1 [Gadus morhua]|uniref:OTU domain-containing protein 1 n=1 Tax=Gadus morhua TaxID=8049 RepID=A0A8C5CNS3_GADMO|nr:OTU domain-containing protein 1 [Gadus morhua]